MDRIKIRNLRSLKDTGYIDIRPLTILVGKNSSGKSTFLRFFPLMKQTLSTKKNEPILWYSKGNVDFGSFEESVNKKSEEKIIGFDFDFKINGRYRGRSKKPAQLSLKVDLMEKSIKRVSIT
ncbi:ATP-binding protein, partial [Bacillus cereus]|nr:ATP-binding protein [Bacillus cereus]